MKIAFLGLGAMGYPMAGRVAQRFETAVWNRTESVAIRHSLEYGSRPVALDEVCASDVVMTCLASAAVVVEVVDRVLPLLRAGTVWIDCTSGEPEVTRELGSRLAGVGVDLLDAPVSGMAHAARAGDLTMLVGGAEDVLDRVRDVVMATSSRVVRTGGVGSAHLVKAANNALFATSFWAAAEVFGALAAAGVEPMRALEAVNACSGRSYLTEQFLPRFVLPRSVESSYRVGQNQANLDTMLSAPELDADRLLLLHAVHEAYASVIARCGPDADAAETFHKIGTRAVDDA
ncbi:MAG: 3-hydroxyisobutyrate dehydrogenase [Pseudonocardiales bacterium]|jgi:3-hydroxyisobutyrate dehydrogenase|nr:3-hydroxyisobutyrate dehydrogenase [Pseudonocardiales bacterium]